MKTEFMRRVKELNWNLSSPFRKNFATENGGKSENQMICLQTP